MWSVQGATPLWRDKGSHRGSRSALLPVRDAQHRQEEGIADLVWQVCQGAALLTLQPSRRIL